MTTTTTTTADEGRKDADTRGGREGEGGRGRGSSRRPGGRGDGRKEANKTARSALLCIQLWPNISLARTQELKMRGSSSTARGANGVGCIRCARARFCITFQLTQTAAAIGLGIHGSSKRPPAIALMVASEPATSTGVSPSLSWQEITGKWGVGYKSHLLNGHGCCVCKNG